MLQEIDALFSKHWRQGITILCSYHGVMHIFIGVADPILLLTPLEEVGRKAPMIKVTQQDPEFISVCTQIKADFANQFSA